MTDEKVIAAGWAVIITLALVFVGTFLVLAVDTWYGELLGVTMVALNAYVFGELQQWAKTND